MFRELRRSQEDPKVLAEQYRKQYFKVLLCSTGPLYHLYHPAFVHIHAPLALLEFKKRIILLFV